MTGARADIAILGGGLAGGLIALAVRRADPSLSVVLVEAGEMLGAMLMTQHNIHFYQQMMQAIRDAISAGVFATFAADFRRDYRRV